MYFLSFQLFLTFLFKLSKGYTGNEQPPWKTCNKIDITVKKLLSAKRGYLKKITFKTNFRLQQCTIYPFFFSSVRFTHIYFCSDFKCVRLTHFLIVRTQINNFIGATESFTFQDNKFQNEFLTFIVYCITISIIVTI